MRIGRAIIDTDNMSIEDIEVVIKELRAIRARKLKAEELMNRMLELIADAKENGFAFIDKDFGYVVGNTDLTLYDEQ